MKSLFFKNLLLSLVAIVLFISPADAQRKKVGVVLSGGGAKGVAHISALKAIEEAGIPIDIITGTSMGAIIGGLYAIGYDTHTLDSMVRTQNWTTLLSDRVPRSNLSFVEKENAEKYLLTMPLAPKKGIVIPSSIVGGQNVYNLITELTIGYHDSLDFRQLPIPFACVAYDMVTGKSHTFESGYLPQAIRASMSIPGAFAPVRMNGMVLVDGGISNNYPVDVAKAMGADLVIGISLSAGPKTEEQLQSLPDLFEQITSFMAADAAKSNIEMTDLYIHPDVAEFTAASFSPAAIDTLIQRGKQAMDDNREELLAFKEKIGLPEDYVPPVRQTLGVNRPINVSEIQFEGLDRYDEKQLLKIMKFKDNKTITAPELHNAMNNLQGSGLFSNVSYRLEGKPPYKLVFKVKESSRNSLSFGFRFDTEEMAGVLLHASLSPPKLFGRTNFYLTGRLNSNPYGKVGIETGNEMTRKFAFSYMFRDNDIDLYYKGDKDNNLNYFYHVLEASFANIGLRNFKTEIGLRYEYFNYRSQLWSRDLHSEVKDEGLVNYYFKANFESLDQRYYPTKGMSLQASATLYTSDFATYKGDSPFGAVFGDFYAAISTNNRFTIIPGAFTRVLIGEHLTYPLLNFAGGTVAGRYMPQQLPFVGIHHFEHFDNSLLGVKLDFRWRAWTRTYISLKTNYMKDHDSFFKLTQGNDTFGVGVCYSYNTIVGPIELMVDWSNRDKKVGVLFNLGYYF